MGKTGDATQPGRKAMNTRAGQYAQGVDRRDSHKGGHARQPDQIASARSLMIGQIMRRLPSPFGRHVRHVGAGRMIDDHIWRKDQIECPQIGQGGFQIVDHGPCCTGADDGGGRGMTIHPQHLGMGPAIPQPSQSRPTAAPNFQHALGVIGQ